MNTVIHLPDLTEQSSTTAPARDHASSRTGWIVPILAIAALIAIIVLHYRYPVFAILHELSHWAAAELTGIPAMIVQDDLTAMDHLSRFVVLAGYWGEFLFIFLLLLLYHRHPIFGGFAFGYMAGVFGRAPNSWDFNILIYQAGGDGETAILCWWIFASPVLLAALCVWLAAMGRYVVDSRNEV